jgi:hypothetical protein
MLQLRSHYTLALALALVIAPIALTCIHPPADFKGSIAQTAQSAILMWHAGQQQLVLKNDYLITPASDGQLPAAIAWVIPVPNNPDDYAVEATSLFEDLYNAYEEAQPRKEWGKDAKHDDRNAPTEDGIELLAKAQAGEYTIQPIKATGEHGAAALNAWLRDNGFGGIPAEAMRYYIERKWIWLAVKVDLASASGTIARQGGLRPLRIGFASHEIVYPLLFSQQKGTFDVVLWVITEQQLAQTDKLRSAVEAYGFKPQASLAIDLPESLTTMQTKAAKKGWKPLVKPFVQQLIAQELNGPSNRIADWTSDFHLDATALTGQPR